jgi:hypothetical protein
MLRRSEEGLVLYREGFKPLVGAMQDLHFKRACLRGWYLGFLDTLHEEQLPHYGSSLYY